MKLKNNYIIITGITLALASCDLDKFPEGQYVSDEQKENIIESRPGKHNRKPSESDYGRS